MFSYSLFVSRSPLEWLDVYVDGSHVWMCASVRADKPISLPNRLHFDCWNFHKEKTKNKSNVCCRHMLHDSHSFRLIGSMHFHVVPVFLNLNGICTAIADGNCVIVIDIVDSWTMFENNQIRPDFVDPHMTELDWTYIELRSILNYNQEPEDKTAHLVLKCRLV